MHRVYWGMFHLDLLLLLLARLFCWNNGRLGVVELTEKFRDRLIKENSFSSDGWLRYPWFFRRFIFVRFLLLFDSFNDLGEIILEREV